MGKKKAGAKAARPADGEEEPDQSGEDLTDDPSPEDRRRKLRATKSPAVEPGRVLPAEKSSGERPVKLPATMDQQQGKTGTVSDSVFIDVDDAVASINPSSSGRHTAYIKGVNINFTDIVRKHEIKFGKEIKTSIGDIDNYRLQRECIRIDCTSADQLTCLLAVKSFLDEPVSVTLPWSGPQKNMEKARKADSKPVRFNKVVVRGVSDEWEDEELQEQAGADFIRRIRRRTGGALQATTAIVLGFVDDPSERVKFGYRYFRTTPYIAEPLQCH